MASRIFIVGENSQSTSLFKEADEEVHALTLDVPFPELINALNEAGPDLIIFNVTKVNSLLWQFCEVIRANSDWSFMKILILADEGAVDDRLAGYKSGIDDFLNRSMDPLELKAKLKALLRAACTDKLLREQNLDLEEKVRVRSDQLLRAERAAFLGMHTAELVHNLNNPLTLLKHNILGLRSKLPSDDGTVDKAMQALDRVHNIVRSILNSGRQENEEPEQDILIKDVLESELKLLESDSFFKNQVKVHVSLEDAPPIRGRYTHFSQSFGNLIKNAIEAIYGCPERSVYVSCRSQAGKLKVQIADTGCGISPDDLDNIFDPFFTTKPMSSKAGEPTGTGLGLPSAKRMLESYGGQIKLVSLKGKGTVVTVTLPQSHERSK